MLVAHDESPPFWEWPNFTRQELSCRHCGELYFWPEFMDRLQTLRNQAGPLFISSGHRCALHNARIGGAPLSQHLKLAVDIDLHGHNKSKLAKQAAALGFTGQGYYNSFLHLDLGRARYWFGEGAKASWV